MRRVGDTVIIRDDLADFYWNDVFLGNTLANEMLDFAGKSFTIKSIEEINLKDFDRIQYKLEGSIFYWSENMFENTNNGSFLFKPGDSVLIISKDLIRTIKVPIKDQNGYNWYVMDQGLDTVPETDLEIVRNLF